MKLKNCWKRIRLLLLLSLLNLSIGHAQDNILDKDIEFKKTDVRISEILLAFADNGITFIYKDNLNSEDKSIILFQKKLKLREVLDLMAKESNLTYKVFNGNLIIKSKIKKEYKVNGFIYCAYSKEPLVAANIVNYSTFECTSTNNYGFYSHSRSDKNVKLRFSCIGYKPFEIELTTANDTSLNIYLEPDNVLQEVTIMDENNSLIKSSQCSNHKLNSKNIEAQTLVGGEKDVLKTIQLLPGIQPALEGSVGLQVRGGSHSQNLVLIDDVPIYNIDHAFGFFSIFNADAIKSVQLYKGAFPARFGGGVSSIVDVRMNEGNKEHFQLDFSTGLLLSKLKIETPIKKNKTSLMISTRYSYLGILLRIADNIVNHGIQEKYGFGDIYAKLNHKISDKSRVYLSCFYGLDNYIKEGKILNTKLGLQDEFQSNLSWYNLALAFRWNYLINDHFFCNSTFTYGSYKYTHKKTHNLSFSIPPNSQIFLQNKKDTNNYSGVQDLGFKVDFDLPVNEKHYLRFGLNPSMHIYEPFMEGNLIMVSKESKYFFLLPSFEISYDTLMRDAKIESYNLSAYFEDDFNLSPQLKANLGFRHNIYFCDSNTYHSPEPRISLRYLVLQSLSIKAGYSRISQNNHLLSSSFLVLPFNVWVPSTKEVKPLYSDQFSLSVNYNLKDFFELSIEGFYKTIQNDILYKNVANAGLSWENYIEQGIRKSYGLEFMASKQTGKITGWLSYTLSKTERKFESVNDGNYFPYWLVRKHKISATLNFKINEKLDFGASWLYSSGVSGNTGYQELSPILFYTSRANSSRSDSWTLVNEIPAYHKLDVGINFHKQIKRTKHTLSLGVNNAYARNNPLLISEFEGYLYLSKINLFMPFLQYSLQFR